MDRRPTDRSMDRRPLSRLSALPTLLLPPLPPLPALAPTTAPRSMPMPPRPAAAAAAAAAARSQTKTVAGAGAATATTTAAAAAAVDDKVLRRRLQYKYHQRRHRAKQKEKTLALERDVRALSADVDALRRRREALADSALLCASRGAASGAPARTVVEFFRQYAGGWSAAREPEQQRFLRSIMTAQTRGPDYTGVEFILDQFRRFGAFFAVMRFDTHAPRVETAGELTVVTIDAVMRVRPHRAGLLAICPGVQSHEDAVQALVGAQLVVPSRYTFIFDASGTVEFFGAESNLLGALQQAVGSLHAVDELFAGAQISSCTGQIYATPTEMPPPPLPREPLDRRLQVDFLLS